MKNKTLVQAYVWHDNEVFFVSTINRSCSAILAYGNIYAETLVWKWNPETRKREGLVGQGECGKNSILTHQQIVQKLFDTGLC